MVGLNEDVEKLLHKSILNQKEGLFVTAIVGMGGIGKSTLAKKLYNHAAVADRFKRRAWVVVSSNFTAEDIMKQIMFKLQISLSEDKRKELESIKDELSREEMLQEILRKELVSNPYFIVLDDVWEREHWDTLRRAFPDQGETCRLLITSRNRFIGQHEGYVHEMRLLNSDESWELLSKTAFLGRSDGRCPKRLESIGEEILKRCCGLPLAIKVAGGLLESQRESLSGWERVLKQILETIDGSPKVIAILELSYLNLPPRLKSCFLSLALFKEDELIRARRLVDIWLAQGFITSCDEGMIYLDELLDRNLVQDMGSTLSGAVKVIHIHDLLRELAIKKAKEEIRFEILRSDDEDGNSSLSKRPLRHVVYLSGEGLLLNQSKQYLRSLFLNNFPPGRLIRLQLLKILHIDGPEISEKMFKEYRDLIGLKYLRIRGAYFGLPTWFNRLRNLEVLEIDEGELGIPLEISSNATWKIDSLRHIHAHRILGTLHKETCKNLETLKYIENGAHIPTRVRKLGLYLTSEEAMRVAAESFKKLENLTQLHLIIHGHINWHPILQAMDHLTQLKLTSTILPKFRKLTSGEFIQLCQLPKLTHLKLSYICNYGEMRVFRGGFPKLQVFSLHKVFHLESIYIEEGGMPELQVLCLRNLGDLCSIFVEEGGMSKLRQVSISKCRRLDTQNLQQYLV